MKHTTLRWGGGGKKKDENGEAAVESSRGENDKDSPHCRIKYYYYIRRLRVPNNNIQCGLNRAKKSRGAGDIVDFKVK